MLSVRELRRRFSSLPTLVLQDVTRAKHFNSLEKGMGRRGGLGRKSTAVERDESGKIFSCGK